MKNTERVARLQLYRTKNIGSVTYNKLMARFGCATSALENLQEINKRYSKNISPPKISEINKEFETAEKTNVKILISGDEHFSIYVNHL